MDEPHSTEDAADHQVQSLRGDELEPGGKQTGAESYGGQCENGISKIFRERVNFVTFVTYVTIQNVIVYHGRTAGRVSSFLYLLVNVF